MDMSTGDKSLQVLAATALVGLMFSANDAYTKVSPEVSDLRDANPGDPIVSARLLDADISVGIPVVLAGVIASWLMKSWLPLGILLLAFVATAGYHHSQLARPSDPS